MKIAVLALVLVFVAGCNSSNSPVPRAEAQLPGDILTWTIPNQRTDNTPLPASEYKATRIQWGTSPSGPFSLGQQTVTGTATTVTIARTSYGQRCYVAVAVDTGDRESEPSNAACKSLTAPPKAPTLTVQ